MNLFDAVPLHREMIQANTVPASGYTAPEEIIAGQHKGASTVAYSLAVMLKKMHDSVPAVVEYSGSGSSSGSSGAYAPIEIQDQV